MLRSHLISVVGVCFLFSACSNPIASDTDSSVSNLSEAQETVKSTTEEASKTIPSVLNKAQSATEKVSSDVYSVLEQVNQASQSVSQIAEDLKTFQTNIEAISTDAGDTLSAVHSGDFNTAQQEFTQLQSNWEQIKDAVKQHSPEIYQKVDTQLNTIDSLLKEPNPDHVKVAQELSLFADKQLALLNFNSQNHE